MAVLINKTIEHIKKPLNKLSQFKDPFQYSDRSKFWKTYVTLIITHSTIFNKQF